MPTITYKRELLEQAARHWPELAAALAKTPGACVTIEVPRGVPGMKGASRGIGDWIALVLHRLGIRKRRGCGCGKRQTALNRLFPAGCFRKLIARLKTLV